MHLDGYARTPKLYWSDAMQAGSMMTATDDVDNPRTARHISRAFVQASSVIRASCSIIQAASSLLRRGIRTAGEIGSWKSCRRMDETHGQSLKQFSLPGVAAKELIERWRSCWMPPFGWLFDFCRWPKCYDVTSLMAFIAALTHEGNETTPGFTVDSWTENSC